MGPQYDPLDGFPPSAYSPLDHVSSHADGHVPDQRSRQSGRFIELDLVDAEMLARSDYLKPDERDEMFDTPVPAYDDDYRLLPREGDDKSSKSERFKVHKVPLLASRRRLIIFFGLALAWFVVGNPRFPDSDDANSFIEGHRRLHS